VESEQADADRKRDSKFRKLMGALDALCLRCGTPLASPQGRR
jgi:hypothetical protein